jgi:hypothetical protein
MVGQNNMLNNADETMHHVEATHIWKCWFWNRDRWAKVKEFWHEHVPNLGELGSTLVPLLLGIYVHFELQSKTGFVRLKTSVFDQSWKQMVLIKKRGTDLKTKLLKVRHTSRRKFVYLGPPIFVLKSSFSNVGSLPSHHLHSPFSGNHQSFMLNKIITCIFIGWLPWLNATGHYLSATALMWVTTRNVALREKMTYLVNSLKECQKSIGTGYLSAFPSEFFDRFEAVQPVWAPYYTIHKVRTAQDLLYSSSQPRVLNILME